MLDRYRSGARRRRAPEGRFRGFAALVLGMAAALAVAFSAAPARAESSIFQVSGVSVDVTAGNAAEAREKALAEGELAAFRRLMERLTLLADRGRLPDLDKSAVDPLVQDLSVANEKTSNVRYLADLTFRFKPEAVRRLLDERGLPFAETSSKPVLVLPVYRSAGALLLWDDPNPWRQAWTHIQVQNGLVPLVLPIGDLADVAAIGAEQAAAGDQARLAAIAKRYRASDTMVASAGLSLDPETTLPAIQISVSRYGVAAGHGESEFGFVGKSGEDVDSLLRRAAQQVAVFVEDAWKRENLIELRKPGTISVRVPIGALPEWLAVRERLDSVAIVRRTDLMLLSKKEARIAIHFIGDADQLKLALQQADLQLTRTGDDWELTLQGAKPRG